MFNAIRKVLHPVLPKSMQYPAPSKEWFSDLHSLMPTHTPDYCILEQYKFQLMFVAGNMMKNMPYHKLIGDGSGYLATAFTRPVFKMFLKNLGVESYPVMVDQEEEDRLQMIGGETLRGPASVKGELYKVRPQQFPAIDTAMENGIFFHRRRIRLFVPENKITIVKSAFIDESTGKSYAQYNEEQRMHELRAWAYVGTDYWSGMLADNYMGLNPPSYLLAPMRIFRPHNKNLHPYYHFNRLDLNAYK